MSSHWCLRTIKSRANLHVGHHRLKLFVKLFPTLPHATAIVRQDFIFRLCFHHLQKNSINKHAHCCHKKFGLVYRLMQLVDCWTPVSEVAGRLQLRSASRQHLTVQPYYWLNTFACLWAFSVAGPTSCNSLIDPTLSSDSFRKLLKTELYASYQTH